jgi:hypothetical protein
VKRAKDVLLLALRRVQPKSLFGSLIRRPIWANRLKISRKGWARNLMLEQMSRPDNLWTEHLTMMDHMRWHRLSGRASDPW